MIPFLWVVPLALYLLSFIICFDSPRWYVRFPFALALIAALGGLCWALYQRQRLGPLRAGGDLLRRALHLLHGLPRRALPAQARPEPSDRLLPDDRRGRCAGRRVRRRRRAAAVHGLLRTALGSVRLRAAVPDGVRLRPSPRGRSNWQEWRWLGCALALVTFAGLDRLLAWLPAHTAKHAAIATGWFTGLRIGMWTVAGPVGGVLDRAQEVPEASSTGAC